MERLLLVLRTLVLVGVAPALAAERPPNKAVDLSAPHTVVASNLAPGASLSQHEPPQPEPALYVGPTLYVGDQARELRKALKHLPRVIRKTLLGRVGPWGMSTESLGVSQWSAGMGLYVRY